ncbi:biliverdin-producing heme oxygenase [Dyadobacter sp. CY323]|uniref:biliverdin-producing heme oxygenase n=1 Tax=Dyadobacter sp. CY323 TaxID=2907302 RepID=UPI001F299EEA|nr:biliverdin-producing heme oxygenase [Dyadobacter sp. CY323]MCE6992249.1 biliverdin-producing heme oxygenase [Dyadobacter sp. CY323]
MNEAGVLKDQDLFIKSLRQETAENHQKLEENRLSKALLEPTVTLSDYQAYLSGLYGVTVSCENQVFPLLNHIFPDLSERYKSGFILNDLKTTGYSDTQIDSLPVYEFGFLSVPDALGVMYVLEGTTLGGRILYKHIHETLGLTEDNGARYFWGYGPQTGVLWKSFISVFARFSAESNEGPAIISNAKKTFTLIDNWLTGSI